MISTVVGYFSLYIGRFLGQGERTNVRRHPRWQNKPDGCGDMWGSQHAQHCHDF